MFNNTTNINIYFLHQTNMSEIFKKLHFYHCYSFVLQFSFVFSKSSPFKKTVLTFPAAYM